jgi:G3E family GTPase
LSLADLVVLNKVDRVSTLPSLPCEAPVLPVSYGRIDPALLFEVRPPDMGPRQLSFDDLDDHSTHAHASYDSVSFESSDPMHPKLFMDFVQARPEGLFRAKGFVNFGTLSLSMHTVGGFVSFEEAEHARTELVLIGTGIDADSLTDWLMACVADGPISDQDLLYVQRYLRRS